MKFASGLGPKNIHKKLLQAIPGIKSRRFGRRVESPVWGDLGRIQ
jgi:hypothetical protein